MAIAGAIIAGGEAARLGGEKPLVRFGDATLLDAVIARFAPQVDTLALNLRGEAAQRFAAAGHTVLHDVEPGLGPLAGIVAALEWARTLGDVDWLATVPGDTPFLPAELVETLRHAATAATPVFAPAPVRAHYLCALWPVDCLETLRAGVKSGALRSLYRAQAELGGVPCAITAPDHAFFNVNTPEDLAEATQLLNR